MNINELGNTNFFSTPANKKVSGNFGFFNKKEKKTVLEHVFSTSKCVQKST